MLIIKDEKCVIFFTEEKLKMLYVFNYEKVVILRKNR